MWADIIIIYIIINWAEFTNTPIGQVCRPLFTDDFRTLVNSRQHKLLFVLWLSQQVYFDQDWRRTALVWMHLGTTLG